MSKLVAGLHWATGLGAVALWREGELVFATPQERVSRIKGDRRCPLQALEAGLAEIGAQPDDVARWVLAGSPDRLADVAWQGWCTRHRIAAASVSSVALQAAQWAQAVGLSPFDEAAVWCSEPHERAGGGERGRWGSQNCLGSEWVPEAGGVGIGAVYGAVTRWLGLRPEGDEWRVMGAAAWGDADRHARAWSDALAWTPDGGVSLRSGWWQPAGDGGVAFCDGAARRVFGAPRPPGAPWAEHHFDLAASVQRLAEDALLRGLRALHRRTGQRHVCLAGSVMLNSLAVGRAAREGPFEGIHVSFAPDTSGAAIGAALCGAREVSELVWQTDRRPQGVSPCLGRRYSGDAIDAAARAAGLHSRPMGEATLMSEAVRRLNRGEVLGWFQGRSEFGPRALGARSIVADPRQPAMQDRINRAVKFREPFRPFAPAVLAEAQAAWFEAGERVVSPYMDKVLPFRPAHAARVPAVVHRDGTGRLQSVFKDGVPARWRSLIEAFARHTGVPMLLDTSFNVDGEPVVDSPADAVRTMQKAGLDALIAEDRLVTRTPLTEHLDPV